MYAGDNVRGAPVSFPHPEGGGSGTLLINAGESSPPRGSMLDSPEKSSRSMAAMIQKVITVVKHTLSDIS